MGKSRGLNSISEARWLVLFGFSISNLKILSVARHGFQEFKGEVYAPGFLVRADAGQRIETCRPAFGL